ncbi:unnamed protein product [Chrysoparadoxa australica]
MLSRENNKNNSAEMAASKVPHPLAELQRGSCGRSIFRGGGVRAPIGLRNHGNTCFLSSALQALAAVSPLREHLLHCTPSSSRRPTPLADALSELMQAMKHGVEPPVLPVMQCLSTGNPTFEVGAQQDAHEALRTLLDLLHEEVKVAVPAEFKPSRVADTPRPPAVDESIARQKAAALSTPELGDSVHANTVPSTPNCSTWPHRQAGTPETRDVREQNTDGNPNGDGSNGSGTAATEEPYWQSIVTEVFEGTLASQVTCLTCGNCSTQSESCLDIAVPLLNGRLGNSAPPAIEASPKCCVKSLSAREEVMPAGETRVHDTQRAANPPHGSDADGGYGSTLVKGVGMWLGIQRVPLYTSLSSFFRSERLSGQESYDCDRCKCKREAAKTLHLRYAPDVLCIHVKRFRKGYFWTHKLHNGMSFPLEGLDMAPFMEKSNGGPVLYDLICLVEHTGVLSHGHWTACTRDDGSGRWFHCNDMCVDEIAASRVAQLTPYLLVYKKRPRQAPREQLLSVLAASTSPSLDLAKDTAATPTHLPASEPVMPQAYVSKAWAVRLLNCADLRPISNHPVVCVHGKIKPSLDVDISIRTGIVSLPQAVLGQLLELCGSGYGQYRSIDDLSSCEQCVTLAKKRSGPRLREQLEANRLSKAPKPRVYCIMSNTWLNRWYKWLQVKETQEDEDYPVPEPGPITNGDLMNREGKLHPNRKSGVHYRAAHPLIWGYLHKRYGGGPLVCRKDPDGLYATPQTLEPGDLEPWCPEPEAEPVNEVDDDESLEDEGDSPLHSDEEEPPGDEGDTAAMEVCDEVSLVELCL